MTELTNDASEQDRLIARVSDPEMPEKPRETLSRDREALHKSPLLSLQAGDWTDKLAVGTSLFHLTTDTEFIHSCAQGRSSMFPLYLSFFRLTYRVRTTSVMSAAHIPTKLGSTFDLSNPRIDVSELHTSFADRRILRNMKCSLGFECTFGRLLPNFCWWRNKSSTQIEKNVTGAKNVRTRKKL